MPEKATPPSDDAPMHGASRNSGRKRELQVQGRQVWAEVSTSALAYNLRAIRAHVNPAEEQSRKTPRLVLSIVKGNGYGHGGPQVAKILEKAGSDWFGVTSASEGVEVRKAGIRKPILILTSFWPGEESTLFKHDLTPVVHRCDQLEQLERAAARHRGKQLSFHLKIDTGMNRIGIPLQDVQCFAQRYAKCRHLKLGGVMTHLASSEAFAGSAQAQQTREQEEHFYVALERLRGLGIDPGIVHLANSAAIASRPETWADMVRPGVILYGYHPGFDPIEQRAEAERVLPLKPVMSLRTRIMSLRSVPAGASVGYGGKFVAHRPSVIGVLAAGYADGVHRSLGNKGSVLIHGQLAPIVGIVSMDVTMIDVTDIQSAETGDVCTIYGVDGDHVHPANQVARSIGTVTSDLLCAVGARVPRFYVS
jgi:alanine racemase